MEKDVLPLCAELALQLLRAQEKTIPLSSSEAPMHTRKAILSTLCFLLFTPGGNFSQNFPDIKPTPQQTAWQDLEIGVLIHFGLNTFTDKEWGDGTVDPKIFNPQQLAPEQWVLAAKAAGAKYLVMVTKHHDGFCLFPSARTKYSVESSPWKGGKGDLVKDVSEACRKHGLRFGVYLSPWDRHEPTYKISVAYDNFYDTQLSELATRYGEITELWLDGAGSEGHVHNFERYARTLRTFQPNTLIFADVGFVPWGDVRWVGNEEGVSPEENWNVVDRHGYLRWRPAECDTPLREKHWFWHPNDEKSLKSLSKLLDTYHQSVGRGAQLVLGLAPDDRGLIPESDALRLREFGEALQRVYRNNLAAEGTFHTDAGDDPARAFDGDPDTFWSAPPNSHSAVLEVSFPKPVRFDRAVAMEWLNVGQRIQKYDIQAWDGKGWRTLHTGTSIGHKKIDVFPRTAATKVRLRILMAADSPHIREFQIFDGSER
jgi:alpha-L-fucosidase